MQHLENFFLHITDQKAVRIVLPITDSPEKQRIPCIYGADTPPKFLLLFQPDTLPVSRIKLNEECFVIVDFGGKNVSISTQVDEIVSDQVLKLTAKDVVSHDQLRDYFRVDAAITVSATLLDAKTNPKNEQLMSFEGETIDISAGGLLCSLPKPLDENSRVKLDLYLQTETAEKIPIVARVVRCERITGHRYYHGFQFEDLTIEDRDIIMGCCFELQRKHLRLKVKVSNIQETQ